MAARQNATITVSTKGQVVLPKEIREAKNWRAGQKLVVEAIREGCFCDQKIHSRRPRSMRYSARWPTTESG